MYDKNNCLPPSVAVQGALDGKSRGEERLMERKKNDAAPSHTAAGTPPFFPQRNPEVASRPENGTAHN